jgi:hypothetical protein
VCVHHHRHNMQQNSSIFRHVKQVWYTTSTMQIMKLNWILRTGIHTFGGGGAAVAATYWRNWPYTHASSSWNLVPSQCISEQWTFVITSTGTKKILQ